MSGLAADPTPDFKDQAVPPDDATAEAIRRRNLSNERRRGGALGNVLTGGAGVGGRPLVGRSTLLGG